MYDSTTMGFSAMGMMSPFGMLFFAALVIIPFWFIFSKAGHSGWLSLLMLVPVVNIVLLYFLAFSDWPALKKQQNT